MIASSTMPVASPVGHDARTQVIKSKNTSFTLFYFGVQSHGATPRALLAYADANWKDAHPTDWSKTEKAQTVFGTLPILFEHSAPDSQGASTTIQIAEAMNIELYLAEKFGLLGDNAGEALEIRGIYSNSRHLMHRQEDTHLVRKPYWAQERQRFIDMYLRQWIAKHEALLVKNGSNGHYVGNRTSLADIKTAVAMEQFLNELHEFPDGDHANLINPTDTPNLWKVRETVRAKDSYRRWIESPAYKKAKEISNTVYAHERNSL